MSFLVLKKCCFCVDLRLGSFMIGYLMLVLRVTVLTIASIRLSSQNAMLQHHGIDGALRAEDVSFHRLIEIISIMILVFEILLCIALVVGLHKRLDQHVEMFYVGSFGFLVIGFLVYGIVVLRYAEVFGAWAWFIVGLEICTRLILIYFLSVIRSYYYKMKDEEKGDREELDARETAKTYFAKTTPVLFSHKP